MASPKNELIETIKFLLFLACCFGCGVGFYEFINYLKS